MISMRQLGAFVAVADTGHFGRAGQCLGVGTAAVSGLVSRLESGLGLHLVRRTSRRVSLTADGAALVDRAREALGAMDRLAMHVDDVRAGASGTLRVGVARHPAGGGAIGSEARGARDAEPGPGARDGGGPTRGATARHAEREWGDAASRRRSQAPDPGLEHESGAAHAARGPATAADTDGIDGVDVIAGAMRDAGAGWCATYVHGTAREVGEAYENGHLDVLITHNPSARGPRPWWHKPWSRPRAPRHLTPVGAATRERRTWIAWRPDVAPNVHASAIRRAAAARGGPGRTAATPDRPRWRGVTREEGEPPPRG